MIDKGKIEELIREYLPQAEDGTVETITHDICRDTEAIIYSAVRQAVSQEREVIQKEYYIDVKRRLPQVAFFLCLLRV